MGYYMGLIGCVVIGLIAFLLECNAAGTTHVVGGDLGWTIAASGAQFYVNWAAPKMFMIGDTLSFNFNAQMHDVAQVTKADYDACTYANPIGAIIRTSPANVPLNTTGEHYYICTFQGHCAAGQKLAINVVSSGTGAPSPTPTVTTGPSAPPTGSTELPCPPDVPTSPSLPPMEFTGPSSSPTMDPSSASSLVVRFVVMGMITILSVIFF
ncbi:umecyanin-like [Magnolia sinica]|uniref:umecyanin-like n=1 Tax=Magnolia sinica TaxID=86752 RepID=UPI002658050A|nr:umecyanin-like [Magnolia sinica]